MSKTNKFHLVLPFVVGIIVDPLGRVLIGRQPNLKRKPYPGYWDLPGGKIESGESPEEALEREIREELGLKVTSCRLLGVFHHSGDSILPECTSTLAGLGIGYLLEVKGKMVSTEQDDVHFADSAALKKMRKTMTPWSRLFLDIYFSDLKHP